VVDQVDEATTPINPFAIAILIVVATAWMIALFALAMRVAAQLNQGG
jgi:type IV secretory pathway TrbD component